MYKPVIGLEVHAELKTKTKMFCDSLNDPDEKHPNINVCPICMGHPGTLPVINMAAIEKVITAGLALNCKIAEDTFFERKNYFYPDLPKGYQISQYQKPLCYEGYLNLQPTTNNSQSKKIRITRIHLEEDAGRLYHLPDKNYSLVDYNRAGVPLMELVTEPDFENGDQVKRFAEELQLIWRYLEVSDANMEKGQMRIEVNISLTNPDGSWGTKVEIKNINSVKFAADAVDYEIKRQRELLESGEKIKQETRGWDEFKKQSFSQRSKEEAHDYRYFPEPDLPPIRIANGRASPATGGPPTLFSAEKIRSEMPELPQQRRERFVRQYG
ncbi:MAG: Aspartyl/glutamyl-tRNA(Asn/Gln) amidotransferase subunit B, partial [Candidatus Yanofskybacteria bacterium GW2011_GWA2_44_9]